MSLLVLLMFVAFQGKPQAASDQVILEHTRKAVFYENSATLQKRCPPSLVPTWQRLQKHTNPHKQTGAALSFLLAYYNVDFNKNLSRILLPYQDWKKGNTSGWYDGGYNVDNLPSLLERLCDKHHKSSLLVTLLDLKTDGAFSESQSISLYNIWSSEPRKLLRLCSTHSERRDNLLRAIWMESGGYSSRIRRVLKPYLQDSDPKIKCTAQLMAKESHQWDK